jgi:hypothetical protein
MQEVRGVVGRNATSFDFLNLMIDLDFGLDFFRGKYDLTHQYCPRKTELCDEGLILFLSSILRTGRADGLQVHLESYQSPRCRICDVSWICCVPKLAVYQLGSQNLTLRLWRCCRRLLCRNVVVCFLEDAAAFVNQARV